MSDRELTGAELRDEGVASVLAADIAVHRGFRHAVEVVVARLVAAGQEFTADDVRVRLPVDVATRMSPHLIGAVISETRRAGTIRQTGWRVSSRPSRHCGPVRTWVATIVIDDEDAAA